MILRFLWDMECGLNTGRGSKKGPRSFIRLNTLRTKLVQIARRFERRYGVSLLEVSEEQLHAFFHAMRSGEIEKPGGGVYRSVSDYVKTYKTLWHWHMKVMRKRGEVLIDICTDLDESKPKPPWVYLTEEHVRKLQRHATPFYRTLIIFLYDTGVRSPTELTNLRVRDVLEDCAKLRIPDFASKTQGRTINLMLCTQELREHISDQGLSADDYLFSLHAPAANRYLRRLAKRTLGTETTLAGKRCDQLRMYDLRHSSACYWLPRYRSESALKYRFGWKRTEMIHYYTELLGMKDTITKDDVHTRDVRTRLAADLESERTQRAQLEEELRQLRTEMRTILKTVRELTDRAA